MRFFPSQAVREAHPVSAHEMLFPELCVDTDTRSYWKMISAGPASADRWERLSGPLQDIPDAPSTARSGYIAEDDQVYIAGRWQLDARRQVDGRVVMIADFDAPKTVTRHVTAGRTITIPQYEQLVMVGPLQLDGRLVCNGNLAFA
jgi:hypothetical protein